ncbi:hypothetical protein NKG94_27820 [Micromonospora sp. M12]
MAATDLLIGVGLGMATAALFMLWRLARCDIHVTEPNSGAWLVSITGTLAFVASGRLTCRLAALPPGQHVELELHLDYLDHGAYETIRDWQASYLRSGGNAQVSEVHGSWLRRAGTDGLGTGKRTSRA